MCDGIIPMNHYLFLDIPLFNVVRFVHILSPGFELSNTASLETHISSFDVVAITE